jgi:Ca-activated chloride channel family protein
MMHNFDVRFWTYDYVFPEAFGLIILLWGVIGFWIFKRSKSGFKTSANARNLSMKSTIFQNVALPYLSRFLLFLSPFFLIFGIAGPHRLREDQINQMQYSEGIDIVLSLDISLSMLARDFEPNRLESAKRVAAEFVSNRPNDRIGLVLYEGEAFTACPVTTDHVMLLKKIAEIKPGVLETNSTAIGMGLGVAVNRLRDDNLKSKVVILMSDGVSNSGEIDPYTATELAKNKNVRVYTIGIGSEGTAPYPQQTVFGVQYVQMPVEIDEEALMYIAENTGGKYFRATDEQALSEIYAVIDQMEKTEMIADFSRFEIPVQAKPFFLVALILMLLSVLFSKLILKGIAHE